MELWNDFEGKTVDGRFQLDHLIGPKGRSAYFTAKDEAGSPAMIRLIESLNDEDEILARWRLVAGLKQEHLVEVLACGQTVLDGTHLVYAVMEPTDAELADVLRERALTPDETRQITLSVADGLDVLHAKGLVHEHVEAENVLAKGETVKLRSDVVREAPEGAEGAELRAKDVRDLAQLVVYSLTRSRQMDAGRLPAPFEEIVRKGESGAWGLKEILGTLRPVAAVSRPAVGAAVRPGAAPAVRPGMAPAARPVAPAVPSRDQASPGTLPAVGAAAAAGAPPSVASRLAQQGDGVGAHLRSPRAPDRIVMETEGEPRRRGLLVAIAAGVLLLVVLGIYFLRAGRAGQTRSAVQDSAAVTNPQQSAENRPPARDAASAPVPQRAETPAAATEARSGSRVATAAGARSAGADWRVVAYTYNHEDQAQHKVSEIAARHSALRPEVFSPNGRAPYLVTMGGWMSRGQAIALRSKARSEGLPRDTFARNYKGR